MKALALSGMETAINSYLNLDPFTIKRLSLLQDKVIKIELTDWEMQFFVHPDEHGIQLLAEQAGTVDTTISGSLNGLIRASQQGGSSSALFENRIDVTGDVQAGEAMRDVMQKLDIDWEEHLSRLVGDTLAHTITTKVADLIKHGKQITGALRENINEHIHEEAQLFPSCAQVEEHYQQINTLRDDVDRAQARMQRLLDKAKED